MPRIVVLVIRGSSYFLCLQSMQDLCAIVLLLTKLYDCLNYKDASKCRGSSRNEVHHIYPDPAETGLSCEPSRPFFQA